MSEWLTTGQMIDRLKVGEVAEGKNNGWKVKYDRKLDLIIVDDVEDVEGDRFLTNAEWVKKDKWRIIPNYVSFEEAIKAMREGKTVYFHPHKNTSLVAGNGRTLAWFDKCNWNELFDGNWTIKGDEK